jgi:DegV family protein with EDD domain
MMQIVTDTGMDMVLPEEDMPEIDIHIIRHKITLDETTYESGKDIQPEELHRKLEETGKLPITSQPSANDFAEMYRQLAATDPDILSIQMSSGLSGVVNSATAGAEMVPEANVTLLNTKTLCVAMGWQVAAAARAVKAGWSLEKVVDLVNRLGDATESIYTLSDLKYLIHGGRISHMKGLIASMLNLKPLIGVEKVGGTYTQMGSARTFNNAIKGLVKLMSSQHTPGSPLRVQVGHALNPDGAARLRDLIDKAFQCTWLPLVSMSPVLAAHTGPTMIGVAYASSDIFEEIP